MKPFNAHHWKFFFQKKKLRMNSFNFCCRCCRCCLLLQCKTIPKMLCDTIIKIIYSKMCNWRNKTILFSFLRPPPVALSILFLNEKLFCLAQTFFFCFYLALSIIFIRVAFQNVTIFGFILLIVLQCFVKCQLLYLITHFRYVCAKKRKVEENQTILAIIINGQSVCCLQQFYMPIYFLFLF